jgi:hypothetical protein
MSVTPPSTPPGARPAQAPADRPPTGIRQQYLAVFASRPGDGKGAKRAVVVAIGSAVRFLQNVVSARPSTSTAPARAPAGLADATAEDEATTGTAFAQ